MSLVSSVLRTPAVLKRRRFSAFATVGAAGFVVQIAALAALTGGAGWNWLPSTVVSVELAVLHNFFWHQRWTWRDRGAIGAGDALLRFHLANGVASIAGNAALMALLVEFVGVPAVVANVIAVGVMSIANFAIADRWVFAGRRTTAVSGAAATLLVVLLPAAASAAGPAIDTLSAWERYVATIESRLERTPWPDARAGSQDDIAADGESNHVPDGTISDWRGSVFIPGITLDHLLHGLQHPGTPPPQDDVVSSRVIARDADSLRVAIRLVRHAIVTVSYDTEHQIRFRA